MVRPLARGMHGAPPRVDDRNFLKTPPHLGSSSLPASLSLVYNKNQCFAQGHHHSQIFATYNLSANATKSVCIPTFPLASNSWLHHPHGHRALDRSKRISYTSTPQLRRQKHLLRADRHLPTISIIEFFSKMGHDTTRYDYGSSLTVEDSADNDGVVRSGPR